MTSEFSLDPIEDTNIYHFQTMSTANTSFDFTDPYSGWLKKYFKEKIGSKLDEMITYYNKKQFIELNTLLHFMYNNTTVFFTESDCIETIDIFNKLLYIKYWLYKYTKRSFLNPAILVNNIDLQLCQFSDSDKNTIRVNCDNSIYTFRIYELLSIYMHSTTNLDYEIPKPLLPKNPYTNEEFTLKQHYVIYEALLNYYCALRRTLPEHYILFKNSYFDTTLFYKKYYVFLMYKTILVSVNTMSNREWLYELDSRCKMIKGYCKICLKKCKNARNIFKNVLELLMLNENDIWAFGSGRNEYIRIAKSNKLYFGKKHYIKHRIIRRPQQSVLSINSRSMNSINAFLSDFM